MGTNLVVSTIVNGKVCCAGKIWGLGLHPLIACGLGIGQFLLLRPLAALAQPWPVYGLALAMALVSTVLPVWAVAEAIRRIGAGPVALTGSLGPIVTLLLAWLLLDEALGVAQLAGAVLVVAGVTVMARR